MTAPNFRRLQMAYDIFKDIPRNRVNLNQVVRKCDAENNHCGTIACGMGWLSLTPSFNRLGVRYDVDYGILVYKGSKQLDYDDIAERIFNIDSETASYLFDPVESASYAPRLTVEYRGIKRREMMSHKSELLKRIETVFQYYGKAVKK